MKYPNSLAKAFERLDRVALDGLFSGVAIASLALAESLKLVRSEAIQTRLLILYAWIVGLAIWCVLRLPASMLSLLGPRA